MAAIDIQDLTVVFPDGTTGLSRVNLEVAEEEFLALIGPSGSGKTTLLRTIAGFLQPSSGSLHIQGRDVTRVPPEKRRMGMVFQQHAVWPHMSVAANVAYPLKQAKVARPERERRVREALELVGLGGYGSRKPASLSGGQQQRVALARAIIADPRVLLLDEALSALDEPLRDSLRRELVSLTRRQGLTTVHVTHDRAEALSIADRVVVLMAGEVQQIAEPAELTRRPATAQVAAFIADAAVLEGSLDDARVTCPALGLSWSQAEVELIGDMGTTTGVVQLAVLPAAVETLPPGTPGAVPARVASVLFAGEYFSLTVETESGHRFRAAVRGPRPRVDEAVSIRITRPLVYPA
ncbi:Trehalose import ATP-binding protein SugC [Corynebacterium occultum]|uniref:ABC-type quaternary amine transporter n=1 Tax=Corynebacterium occultum TaxID=2675219 RepID=A0A6B8VKX2_9CORY|nr:ABC transporter ATP-binding protein [Corynebacterium occultum]QGU06062.1 Trehalose import ATP-binding protein SugC [Corynebacterium occultum]